MSPGWTLLGTIGQLALANFMFMLAVFTGGGLASTSYAWYAMPLVGALLYVAYVRALCRRP